MTIETRLERLERRVRERREAKLARDGRLPYMAVTDGGLFRFATEAEMEAALSRIAFEHVVVFVDTRQLDENVTE